MGQILHGSATTTHAIRAAIQRSCALYAALSRELGITVKTVAKWRKRRTVEDVRMGPKEAHSTILSVEEDAVIVAFRRHTLLPLDDCLYAPQPSIPHLTRSSLHRCLQRHNISRLPGMEGDKPKKKFGCYPIGYVHIDIAELRTAEGKLYMFAAIDRTSKFAVVRLGKKAGLPNSCAISSRRCPTGSTRSSPTTISSSQTVNRIAMRWSTSSTGFARSTGSSIA